MHQEFVMCKSILCPLYIIEPICTNIAFSQEQLMNGTTFQQMPCLYSLCYSIVGLNYCTQTTVHV